MNHIWVVLSRICFLGGIIKDLDTLLDIAGSSVTLIRVSKEARSLEVDWFDVGVSFHLVTVGRRIIH